MIKIRINGPAGLRAARLPLDNTSLGRELELAGITVPPDFVPLDRARMWNIEIKGTNDVERHLIKMCSDKGTLKTLNQAVKAVAGAHKLIRPQLEQNIISDQYHSLDELQNGIRTLTMESSHAHETYYFPLHAELNVGEEKVEADENVLMAVTDRLRENFAVHTSEDAAGYANSYMGPGKKKLFLAEWGFEELPDGLYGKVDIYSREPLTDTEDENIREWISEQNRGGLWESFNRQSYTTDFGDVTVHFSNQLEDIQTQAEMELTEQSAGCHMM